jgi:hypothetical protein
MDTLNRRQELERLREESCTLEEKAGLTQKMVDAQTPHSNPEWTSKEYFEYVECHLYFETRSLYFSVSDTELRKKLIATKRKVDASYQLSLEEDVMAAKHDVSVALTRAKQRPWLKLVSYSFVVSIVSWLIFGIKGTIAGIIFALYFFENEKEEVTYELSRAQEALQDAQKTKAEESNAPEVFSTAEEQNGTEDVFDDEPSDLPRHYATGKLRSTKL